jgi:hypothetical protein
MPAAEPARTSCRFGRDREENMKNIDLENLDTNVETDRISTVDSDPVDRVSAGDWNRDDGIAFLEEVMSPGGSNAAAGAGNAIDMSGSSESVTGRISSLASLFESQRKSTERAMAAAQKNADPRVQAKMARQVSDMYLNHELAFKLIGKLEQGMETVMKLQ